MAQLSPGQKMLQEKMATELNLRGRKGAENGGSAVQARKTGDRAPPELMVCLGNTG